MPITINHSLSATTPDNTSEVLRQKQREANKRSYYKHLESRRAYYRELSKIRRAADPDGYNAYQRKTQTAYRRRDGVPEKVRNSAEMAKAKAKEQYAKWAKANPHMTAALAAKRRANKKMATPIWADVSAMRVFYKEASRLTEITGIPHEVDHFYPISGAIVCGLHCEDNLRVITATENIRKSNKCP